MKFLLTLVLTIICFSGCNHHDKTKAVFNVAPVDTNTIIVDVNTNTEYNCYYLEHLHPETETEAPETEAPEAPKAHPEHPINPNHPVHPQ